MREIGELNTSAHLRAQEISKFLRNFREISTLFQRNNERNLALLRRNKGQPQHRQAEYLAYRKSRRNFMSSEKLRALVQWTGLLRQYWQDSNTPAPAVVEVGTYTNFRNYCEISKISLRKKISLRNFREISTLFQRNDERNFDPFTAK